MGTRHIVIDSRRCHVVPLSDVIGHDGVESAPQGASRRTRTILVIHIPNVAQWCVTIANVAGVRTSQDSFRRS